MAPGVEVEHAGELPVVQHAAHGLHDAALVGLHRRQRPQTVQGDDLLVGPWSANSDCIVAFDGSVEMATLPSALMLWSNRICGWPPGMPVVPWSLMLHVHVAPNDTPLRNRR